MSFWVYFQELSLGMLSLEPQVKVAELDHYLGYHLVTFWVYCFYLCLKQQSLLSVIIVRRCRLPSLLLV